MTYRCDEKSVDIFLKNIDDFEVEPKSSKNSWEYMATNDFSSFKLSQIDTSRE